MTYLKTAAWPTAIVGCPVITESLPNSERLTVKLCTSPRSTKYGNLVALSFACSLWACKFNENRQFLYQLIYDGWLEQNLASRTDIQIFKYFLSKRINETGFDSRPAYLENHWTPPASTPHGPSVQLGTHLHGLVSVRSYPSRELEASFLVNREMVDWHMSSRRWMLMF